MEFRIVPSVQGFTIDVILTGHLTVNIQASTSAGVGVPNPTRCKKILLSIVLDMFKAQCCYL